MGKSFVGYREPNGACRVLRLRGKVHEPLPLQLDLWAHSPDGFSWGYAGSGPSQLALAILADVTERPALALALHQGFKADVVMHLPRERWVLTHAQVVEWVLKECERKLDLVADYRVAEVPSHA